MRAALNPSLTGTHHALVDAVYQAELFRKIREIAGRPQEEAKSEHGV